MKEEILSRRGILRGALTVGCGLVLPVALWGCDSRPGASSTGPAPASPPASSPDAGAAAVAKKVPPASVQYRGQPKGELKCGDCMHFIAGANTCKLVEGPISPDGWCVIWAKKA